MWMKSTLQCLLYFSIYLAEEAVLFISDNAFFQFLKCDLLDFSVFLRSAVGWNVLSIIPFKTFSVH